MDITSVLLQAQSMDMALRKQAEATLKTAEESNFAMFLFALIAEMQDASKPSTARILAGLLLKNSLTAKDSARAQVLSQRWVAVDPAMKAQVKAAGLHCLGADVEQVRSAAALLVARIGLIELPRREWPELIGNLASALTSKGVPDTLREAALTTLGFICEEVDPPSIAEHTNVVLTAVVQGLQPEEPNPRVKMAAITALLNSLDFIKHNFDVQTERDYIMRVVLESTRATDAKVRACAFECLVRITSSYYDKIASYMQAIFNVSVGLISAATDKEEVLMQAIEFWSNLSDIELTLAENEADALASNTPVDPSEKCQRFVQGAHKYLVEALCNVLLKQDEDAEPEQWDPPAAAATCLSLVAMVVGDEIMSTVLAFVQKNINGAEWNARHAATLAFGSIMEGPQQITQLINSPGVIDTLLAHLKDESELVRDTTAWTLGRILMLHHTAITAIPDRFQKVTAGLVAGFKDVPRVATVCCWGIGNLANSLYTRGPTPATSPLSQLFEPLAGELLTAADRQDADKALRGAAYAALSSLVSTSALDCVNSVSKLAISCSERLDRFIANTAAPQKEREEAQSLCCSVVTECVNKLGGQGVAPAAQQLYALYARLFTSGAGASAQEEAIIGISALASALDMQFAPYAPQFLPVLFNCLRSAGEYELLKTAVGVVGDICRVLGQSFAPYTQEVVPLLLAALSNNAVDRSVKPPVLSCLGDIGLAVGAAMVPFLPQTLQTLAQASALQANHEDDDQIEYVNKLREAIFEALTGIIQGVRSTQPASLVPHVNLILSTINNVFNDPIRTDEVARGIVSAIGDLTHALGVQLRPALAPGAPGANLKAMVIEIGQNADSAQTHEAATWAKEMLDKL